MSATASSRADRRVETAWVVTAMLILASVFVWPAWEDVALVLVWSTLALVGLRRTTVWNVSRMRRVIAVTATASGVAVIFASDTRSETIKEAAELVALAVMVSLIVELARRYRSATEEQADLALTEHQMLEREREFFRSASHELRTPITIARGHVELCQQAITDEVVRADLAIVVEELERLSTTAERLLLLATADDPTFLRLGPVSVAVMLERLSARWSVVPRRWSFDIRAPGWLEADERRLEAAIDVLIENAVVQTGEVDEIVVGARSHGDRLQITVSDSGPGIAPERIPTLFDRPRLTDLPDRRRGTGLGLPSAAGLVRSHGGTISVVSSGSGSTTFSIELFGYVAAPSGDRAFPSAALTAGAANTQQRAG
jgi:two-component system, OmpR family, sensor kinase